MAFINFDDKHRISMCKVDFLGRWKTILNIRNITHPARPNTHALQSCNEKRNKCTNKHDFIV
jgi:hypothetical protein